MTLWANSGTRALNTPPKPMATWKDKRGGTSI